MFRDSFALTTSFWVAKVERLVAGRGSITFMFFFLAFPRAFCLATV